jgi:thiamine transport system permease protein
MTKVGVYAIARMSTLTTGDGGGFLSGLLSTVLPLLGLGTLALAAIGAFAAQQLRGLVAYLVVASAGTLLVAIGLGTPGTLAAALFYLVNSTLVACLWFLLADRIAWARGGDDGLSPRGLQHGWAWFGALFFVSAVAVAGVPPLAGFLGKALLLQAAQAAWFGQGLAVLHEADTWLAVGNTLRFSGLALALATALGLLHALAGQAMRRWAPATLAWRASAYAPLVVSPVALAFGLLLLYPQWLASWPLLVAAYALLAYPFVAKALTAALDALPESYAQAAASLGARPVRVFWRVTLPLVAPALRRGMAFAAATMLGEFAVSLLLSRPEWLTLSTLIYQRLGRPGSANLDAALVLSAGLMALALLVFWFVEGRDPNPSGPRRALQQDARHA